MDRTGLFFIVFVKLIYSLDRYFDSGISFAKHVNELRELARREGLNRAIAAAPVMMTNEKARLRVLNALKDKAEAEGTLFTIDPGETAPLVCYLLFYYVFLISLYVLFSYRSLGQGAP